MSSSDEVLSWSYFRPRPAPPRFEVRPPAAEVAEILRRHRDELDAQHRDAADRVDEARGHLAEQAVLVFHLGNTLARHAQVLDRPECAGLRRHLSILRDQMTTALHAAGITMQDPAGAAYRDVEQIVEVTAWREDPRYTSETVAETTEPVVLHHERVIRNGRIIGGNPPGAGHR